MSLGASFSAEAPSPESPAALSAEDRGRIDRAVVEARESGQTRWVAWVRGDGDRDSLDAYAYACEAAEREASGTRERFFWETVAAGDYAVAWDAVDECESAGVDRFEDVRQWAASRRARIDWLGQARESTAPLFLGGFGFEAESRGGADWKAFPPARFVLPGTLLERHAGVARTILFARVEPGASASAVEADLVSRAHEIESQCARPGSDARSAFDFDVSLAETPARWPMGPEYRVQSDRSHAVFLAQVDRALEEIALGDLDKVVLARSLFVDHDGAIDVPAFLRRLRDLYPTCTLMAVGRGDETFLAATPESLVRLEGARVETAALAGSAARGRQPEEDRALGAALLSSEKERSEHAHVVRSIEAVLRPVCTALRVPDHPELRRLFGIQHLETAIDGTMRCDAEGRPESDLLSLVATLHPTPAVAGFPKTAAQDWLVRREGLDRGWYAAPLGWLDGDGGGDFKVALRSALIRNGLAQDGEPGASRTHLFAGAGIVAGSDPQGELAETRVKLRALLAPLTEI